MYSLILHAMRGKMVAKRSVATSEHGEPAVSQLWESLHASNTAQQPLYSAHQRWSISPRHLKSLGVVLGWRLAGCEVFEEMRSSCAREWNQTVTSTESVAVADVWCTYKHVQACTKLQWPVPRCSAELWWIMHSGEKIMHSREKSCTPVT